MTPPQWAIAEIKERFCNWWVFIHNSDFWFVDQYDRSYKDRFDWYQFAECASWTLGHRRRLKISIDDTLGRDFTLGGWFTELFNQITSV